MVSYSKPAVASSSLCWDVCLFVLSCQGNMILQTGSRQTRQTGQMASLLNSSPAFVPELLVAVPIRKWIRKPFSWEKYSKGGLLASTLVKTFVPL